MKQVEKTNEILFTIAWTVFCYTVIAFAELAKITAETHYGKERNDKK